MIQIPSRPERRVYLGLGVILGTLILLDGAIIGARAGRSTRLGQRMAGRAFWRVFPIMLLCTVAFALTFAVYWATTINLPLPR